MRWENVHKEVLLRLAVNGVAGAGGHDIYMPGSCPCGHHFPPLSAAQCVAGSYRQRDHAFWDCPVAAAVRAQLAAGMGGVAVSKQALWLMEPPAGGMVSAVWGVVCLAALSAIDHGRRRLWAQFCQADKPAVDPQAPPPFVQQAARGAAAQFWLLLHDFVAVRHDMTQALWGGVGPAHPFLARPVQPEGRPVAGLVVVVPAGIDLG